MDILEVIHQRRSVRQFTEQAIDRDCLEKIVQAGQAAPSAMNQQKLRFTIVRDPEAIAHLQQAIGEALHLENYHGLYAATGLILLTCPKDLGNAYFDAGCAMQNMMLAAAFLGVGSVWINQLKEIWDQPIIRQIFDAWAIPQDHRAACLLALGMPRESVFGDRENKTIVHWVESL